MTTIQCDRDSIESLMNPMQTDDRETRLHRAAANAAHEMGCELVEVRLRQTARRGVLTVTVDRPDGVSVDDCARVSRRLSEALDASDPIDGGYVLEVSSPGLTRRLQTAADYHRFRGHLARFEFRQPHHGRRRLRGILAEASADGLVAIEETPGGQRHEFPLDSIASARLDFDPREMKRAARRTGDRS